MTEFGELLGGRQGRKPIGRVVSATWDSERQAIRFTIEFTGSGTRINGEIPSGTDPATGTMVTPRELERKLPQICNLVVYDQLGSLDPASLTPERLRRLRIKLSLNDLNISVVERPSAPDANSFLARLF